MPVARADCGGAAADVVALVTVLGVRVKPVVLVVAVVVAVFSCKPNPTSNSINVVFDDSTLYLFKQQTIL